MSLPKLSLALISLLLLPLQGTAQSNVDQDWPCIQALVPELAAAVVWPEYIEEDQLGTWRDDPELKKLALDYGSLEVFSEAERTALAEFAESVPEDQRLVRFNRLVDGILHTVNKRRSHYIGGIKKYARQQSAVALQIEGFLNEKADLEGQQGAEVDSKREQLDATARWHQRIFDQRERAIGPLCDAPVELESVAGDILRELAQYLP